MTTKRLTKRYYRDGHSEWKYMPEVSDTVKEVEYPGGKNITTVKYTIDGNKMTMVEDYAYNSEGKEILYTRSVTKDPKYVITDKDVTEGVFQRIKKYDFDGKLVEETGTYNPSRNSYKANYTHNPDGTIDRTAVNTDTGKLLEYSKVANDGTELERSFAFADWMYAPELHDASFVNNLYKFVKVPAPLEDDKGLIGYVYDMNTNKRTGAVHEHKEPNGHTSVNIVINRYSTINSSNDQYGIKISATDDHFMKQLSMKLDYPDDNVIAYLHKDYTLKQKVENAPRHVIHREGNSEYVLSKLCVRHYDKATGKLLCEYDDYSKTEYVDEIIED